MTTKTKLTVERFWELLCQASDGLITMTPQTLAEIETYSPARYQGVRELVKLLNKEFNR